MNVSVRSYLLVGAAAVTATAVTLTPVQIMPADVAVPAKPSSVQPQLSQSMVDLLAAAGRMTAALPVGAAPSSGAAPAFGTAPAAAVTAGPTADALAFPGIESAIINTYLFGEEWVDYAVDLAAYAVGWIPGIGLLAPQIPMLYDFGEAIVASVVYNVAYLIGGSVTLVQGISNVINDSIAAGVALANAEIDWVGGFLPPLPPLPFAATETTALRAAPTGSLTDVVAKARAHFVSAIKDLTEGALVNRAGTASDQAALTESAAVDVPAAGTVNTPQAAETKTLDQDSTAPTLDQQDVVTSVPTSVQQSLKPDKTPAVKTADVDGKTPRSLTKSVRDGARKAAATVRADMKKAAENVRKVVKDVRKGITGSATGKPKKDAKDKAQNKPAGGDKE